ncbi:MAG: HAMP domain-containing protein [Clostridia bacterium]|nr:HAMP domain-containing protein [Clostridia bacterium]
MLRFRRFTRTILAILTLYSVVLITALYFVSSALARDTTRRLIAQEVTRAVQTGEMLLAEKGPDLDAAVNPRLNPGEVFLILYDADGTPLATTPNAPSVDPARLGREMTEIDALPGMLVMGIRLDIGSVVAGKALKSSEQANVGFRTLLMQYGLIALALTLLIYILLALRIMQPVDMLSSAAQRLSDGEQVEITEKLPVELRSLGRAFNHMSHRLTQSMGELTYERDTLSRVLESLDEGVLAVDRAGDILRENQAAVRLLRGRDSEYTTQVLSLLQKAAEGPQDDLLLQIGETTVLAVFRPLSSGAGALAVLRDVTEHERLERTRREYVANISHELRTPLSSMRGITEGLRDGLVTSEEERHRYYEMILNEVLRLSRLVNDLLELSHLQSSAAAFATEETDALELVYEVHDRAKTLADNKGVQLLLDVPEALPDVMTNEDRIQQVLTILLDNAIKFTPPGGQVTLSVQQEARFLRFAVRDTGIGMDAYTLEHAFDRFHQADHSHNSQGSGLGLAIAQEIMQRLDSRITARSKEGEGSEFSFMLRVFEAETD